MQRWVSAFFVKTVSEYPRLLEALRECELFDDTHVVFFSDHGDLHGSHGQFMKTAPWEER